MRLVVALLLLGTALGQDCPTADGDTVCEQSYDPVTCDGCAYPNECEANAAGAQNCVASCAEPDPTEACTYEYAPVACGGFVWCIYDNLCLALAAGKQEIDCVRDCPSIAEGTVVPCTADYNPYFCGGCFYANECEKDAAWVGNGLPDSSCTPVGDVAAVTMSTQECPTVPGEIACTLDYRPQTCDNNCTYVNTCMANAANATGCSDTCPASAGEKACTREYEPVICGGSCVYNNICLAEDAGIDPAACGPVCTDPPESDTTACTTEYAPVYCQGCEFPNACVAESAGFNVTADCQSIATPMTRQTAADSPTAAPAETPTDAPADSPTDAPTSSSSSMTQAAALLASLMLLPFVLAY